MSLYTHLPDKASLLEVMLDFAFVEVALTGNSWREVLESGAHAILEACLAALEDTPLEEEEKLDAVMTLGSYARGSAYLSVGLAQAARSSGLDDAQLQRHTVVRMPVFSIRNDSRIPQNSSAGTIGRLRRTGWRTSDSPGVYNASSTASSR